ncbi:hypothetical protein GOQ27_03660 [Clostridium sp. D2Q-11]|uniref:Uncharacterized protein n=1 Tax=Anaeromonas frigoriresistens TaxID=2683708 RepID=A0A942UQW2_9FIRM|nr:hypothetical protein [Anaeromonas frigoriresistens]MBS4537543.1 hypothetical protein [Anaeromonas frigoriresistens]
MKNRNKYINWIVFILSIVSILISLKLLWNMGIYVYEHGTSPNIVYGGDFWLNMAWVRLFILGVLSIISGIKLFNSEHK